MINENFPEEFIHVINMDSKSADYLLDKKFDYIFYTGSVSVGKLIMEKASKHLTPITLELGGKSPCIVDKEGNIDIFAKRIVWGGKFLNAGQTCVAPDYVYVHKDIKDKLIEKNCKIYRIFLWENIKDNDEYPRIINKKNNLID